MLRFFFAHVHAAFGALLFVALLSAGCRSKSVDPLAQDRAQLLALAQSSGDFHQDAVLMLSPDFLQEQIQRKVDAQLAKNAGAFRFEAGEGATFVLTPKVLLGSLKVLPASADRAHVRVPLAVSIGVVLEGGLPLPIPPLNFSATLDAMVGLRVEQNNVVVDGRQEGDGVKIEEVQWGEMGGFLPTEMKARVQTEIEQFLGRAGDAMVLFALPASSIEVQQIRARSVAGAGVAVDFSFVLLEHSQPAEVPLVQRGALLAVPEKTLFELTRAAALKSEPIQGRTFEPAALTLTDEGFVLDLRVWTMGKKPKARTYRSESLLSAKAGALRIDTQKGDEVGEGADDFGPLRLFERSKILENLERSLSQVISFEGKEFEVSNVNREGSLLVVELSSVLLR